MLTAIVADEYPKGSHSNRLVMPIPTEITQSKIHQRLSQLIVTLIEDIGSERKLGRMTSLSANGIGKWCDLKADPHLLKLIQFAYSLGWSMTELMSFAEGDEDPQVAIARKKKALSLQLNKKKFIKSVSINQNFHRDEHEGIC